MTLSRMTGRTTTRPALLRLTTDQEIAKMKSKSFKFLAQDPVQDPNESLHRRSTRRPRLSHRTSSNNDSHGRRPSSHSSTHSQSSNLTPQDLMERKIIGMMVQNLDTSTSHNARTLSMSRRTMSLPRRGSDGSEDSDVDPEASIMQEADAAFDVHDYSGLRRRGSVKLSPMKFPDAIKDLYLFRN